MRTANYLRQRKLPEIVFEIEKCRSVPGAAFQLDQTLKLTEVEPSSSWTNS